MGWSLSFKDKAIKQLAKLDKSTKEQIKKYLDKVSSSENPKAFGKPLVGDRAGLWRYRVGNYRIVCQIMDGELLVLVLNIDHRSEVYK